MCRECGLDSPGINRVVAFDRITDRNLHDRCMYVTTNSVMSETDAPKKNDYAVCPDIFNDYDSE